MSINLKNEYDNYENELIKEYKMTPIHVEVRNNNYKNVESLISKNKNNINNQDRYGRTPLHYSIYYQYTNLVKLLLEKNADIYLKDNMKISPYDYVNHKLYNKDNFIKKLINNKHNRYVSLLDYNKELNVKEYDVNDLDIKNYNPLYELLEIKDGGRITNKNKSKKKNKKRNKNKKKLNKKNNSYKKKHK